MGRPRSTKGSQSLDELVQARVPGWAKKAYTVIVKQKGLSVATALRVHILETIEYEANPTTDKEDT